MDNANELKTKTVSSVVWKLSERISVQLINFIVSIILARILLPEEYGIIAMVTVFITVADTFVSNGLGTSLIQRKDANDKDFSTMFYASIVLSVILYAILYFSAPLIVNIYKNNDLIHILRIMGLRLPIDAISSIQQAHIYRKMEYKKFFISTLTGTVLSGILGIVLAFKNFGVWALVYQYLSLALINTVMLFIIGDWRPKLQFSKERFKKLFPFGWKVMITGVIGTIFDQLKSFVIGARYTSADLAFYNRGEQMPGMIYNNVNATFESVLLSLMSKIQDNTEAVKQTFRKLIRIISYLIVPMMVGLAIVSETLVRVILTDKWIECVPYMVIICFSQCISIMGNTHLQVIKAVGRSDILLRLEIIKKPLFIIAIICAVQISPLAIVIANFIYNIVGMIINAFPTKKLIKYTIKEQINDIIVPMLLSLAMALAVLPISLLKLPNMWTLILQVAVGGIVYIGLSILFKVSSLYYLLNNISQVNKIKSGIMKWLRSIRNTFFRLPIFSVNKNKIVFANFLGKGYGDNPKYICEEIINQKLNYDIVWLVNDKKEEMPKQIRKVKFGSIRAYYELATAGVWVDNVRKNYQCIPKKNNQFYIQTWHGAIALKAVEADAQDKLEKSYIEEAKNDSKMVDLIITNNKDQEQYIKKHFWYNGKVLCCGSPRCDILYNTPANIKEKVYNYFNIDPEKKIVLYAPTFRKSETMSMYNFNYEKCCKVLSDKFGSEFVMLIRLHPNITNMSNSIQYNGEIINASTYPDIQEILAVTHTIITDYSSVSFEVGLINKPVFLLAKDLEQYTSGDRKLIYDLRQTPFSIAVDDEQLFNNILNFNMKEYEGKCTVFNDKIGVVHTAHASSEIVKIIKERRDL